jgi:predicted house-cleaning NTP pyrophosphatase (Maf/HAM1 superfamily)
MSIILASASPRRRELLTRAGAGDLLVVPADADETIPEGTPPEEAVKLLAERKAQACAHTAGPGDVIVAADTVVYLDNEILGKPIDEAYCYAKPSSFSRGLRLDLNGVAILLISGTASIGANGETLHAGDFRAQTQRTFANITALLESEGATWKDVVRTTCYLRDIERDYAAFNEERTAFYQEQGLDPLPASTGIQAILCRPDLLVEIEAIAMFRASKQE